MTRRKLEYSRETQGAAARELVVFTLAGFLSGSEPAYEFQDEVRRKVAGGSRKIVIDLAGVERIDSCGIGILASLMWSASQVKGGMVLAAVPRQVEKLLPIVMLLDHIDHAASREAAIALLQGR